MTEQQNEFAAIYGQAAKHADYCAGDTVRFWDHSAPGGQNSGEILHVVAATATTPLILVVSPEVGLFPVEIRVSEVIAG